MAHATEGPREVPSHKCTFPARNVRPSASDFHTREERVSHDWWCIESPPKHEPGLTLHRIHWSHLRNQSTNPARQVTLLSQLATAKSRLPYLGRLRQRPSRLRVADEGVGGFGRHCGWEDQRPIPKRQTAKKESNIDSRPRTAIHDSLVFSCFDLRWSLNVYPTWRVMQTTSQVIDGIHWRGTKCKMENVGSFQGCRVVAIYAVVRCWRVKFERS